MFYVGQRVQCVDDRAYDDRPIQIVKGSIYTISSIFAGVYGPAVTLAEMVCIDGPGWRGSRFRPVVERKTSISIFKAMLNPSREDVSA